MRNFILLSGFALINAMTAASAWAAPFCVEAQGLPPECLYVDAVQCRQRADALKGQCVANTSELTIGTGTGKYCSVDSGRVVQCLYADRTSCENESRKQGAVCIEAEAAAIQRDPYQLDPNRKY